MFVPSIVLDSKQGEHGVFNDKLYYSLGAASILCNHFLGGFAPLGG